jgi:hypothetical protein
MTKYTPKFKVGDIIQVVSNKYTRYSINIGVPFEVCVINNATNNEGEHKIIYRDSQHDGAYQGDCELFRVDNWKEKIDGGQ